MPTALLAFRNSCHICRVGYKDIHNHDYCLLLTIANADIDAAMAPIRLISGDIGVQLLCKMVDGRGTGIYRAELVSQARRSCVRERCVR